MENPVDRFREKLRETELHMASLTLQSCKHYGDLKKVAYLSFKNPDTIHMLPLSIAQQRLVELDKKSTKIKTYHLPIGDPPQKLRQLTNNTHVNDSKLDDFQIKVDTFRLPAFSSEHHPLETLRDGLASAHNPDGEGFVKLVEEYKNLSNISSDLNSKVMSDLLGESLHSQTSNDTASNFQRYLERRKGKSTNRRHLSREDVLGLNADSSSEDEPIDWNDSNDRHISNGIMNEDLRSLGYQRDISSKITTENIEEDRKRKRSGIIKPRTPIFTPVVMTPGGLKMMTAKFGEKPNWYSDEVKRQLKENGLLEDDWGHLRALSAKGATKNGPRGWLDGSTGDWEMPPSKLTEQQVASIHMRTHKVSRGQQTRTISKHDGDIN